MSNLYENLSITKEQVEEFEKWKTEYKENMLFARRIIRSENKGDSIAYTMCRNLQEHAETLRFKEKQVLVDGKVITSDMKFGYHLRAYVRGFRAIVCKYTGAMGGDLLYQLCSAEIELPKIFGLD